MGCGWTPHGDVDYSRVQAVEVVNGIDADTPFSGIGFWERLLNRGYHLTAIGGSDNHDALLRNSGAIGTPTTVIFADELSQEGIVAAIRRGRVFIDVAGTRDRSIELTATVGGQVAHMGDTLTLARGVSVRFDGVVTGVPSGALELIVDGERAPLLKDARIDSMAGGGTGKSFGFPWRADGKAHWVRVDVRDSAARLALVGNPVYIRGSAR